MSGYGFRINHPPLGASHCLSRVMTVRRTLILYRYIVYIYYCKGSVREETVVTLVNIYTHVYIYIYTLRFILSPFCRLYYSQYIYNIYILAYHLFFDDDYGKKYILHCTHGDHHQLTPTLSYKQPTHYAYSLSSIYNNNKCVNTCNTLYIYTPDDHPTYKV